MYSSECVRVHARSRAQNTPSRELAVGVGGLKEHAHRLRDRSKGGLRTEPRWEAPLAQKAEVGKPLANFSAGILAEYPLS